MQRFKLEKSASKVHAFCIRDIDTFDCDYLSGSDTPEMFESLHNLFFYPGIFSTL